MGEMQQCFKREILFRRYLLVIVKIILNQVKYTLFYTKQTNPNQPGFLERWEERERKG